MPAEETASVCVQLWPDMPEIAACKKTSVLPGGIDISVVSFCLILGFSRCFSCLTMQTNYEKR